MWAAGEEYTWLNIYHVEGRAYGLPTSNHFTNQSNNQNSLMNDAVSHLVSVHLCLVQLEWLYGNSITECFR